MKQNTVKKKEMKEEKLSPPKKSKEPSKPKQLCFKVPELIEREKLPTGAKLFYGELLALMTKEGCSFAGNAYFANLYGKTPVTIQRWINVLEEKGYIKVQSENVPGERRKFRTITVVARKEKKPKPKR